MTQDKIGAIEEPQTASILKENARTVSWTAQEIHDAFKEAVATGGPVLIAAAMRNPSHKYTVDPILEKSPLMRLCIAAANLGITNLVFDPTGDYVAALGNYQSKESTFCEVIGEKGIPAFFLYWCTLNAAFFDASLQRRGIHHKTSAPSPENPNLLESTIVDSIVDHAIFDPQNDKHLTNLRQVLEHLRNEAKSYTLAAQRVESALSF